MTEQKKPAGYVVFGEEHLRDGHEDWAKAFDNLPDALAYINKAANGFAGDNCRFKLFTLGEEIPLQPDDVETPQPAKVERRFVVAKGAAHA